MYWIGVLALIMVYILGFSFLGSSDTLLNLGSLFIICVVVFPLLISSGQFNYFLMGIKISFGRIKKAPTNEVKKVIIAMKLAIKLTILSGIIGFLVGGILILANQSTIRMLGQSVALAVVSILYSLFGVTLLLPVQAKVEAFMIDISKGSIDIDEMSGDSDE